MRSPQHSDRALKAGPPPSEVFLKAIAANDAVPHLRALDAAGVLGAVLPELEATKGVTQPKEHYWNVFDHSLETVGAAEKVIGVPLLAPDLFDPKTYFAGELLPGYTRLTMLKLAALLHDLGKPATKAVDSKGRMRFLGHQKVGAAMAAEAVTRLGLPQKAVDYVFTLVEQHLRPGHLSADGPPSERALTRFIRDTNGATTDVLYLNLADHVAMRGPLLGEEELIAHAKFTAEVLRRYLQRQTATQPVRLVNGDDLMRELGLVPGPALGRVLKAVEDAQKRGEVATRAEAIALAKKIARLLV